MIVVVAGRGEDDEAASRVGRGGVQANSSSSIYLIQHTVL